MNVLKKIGLGFIGLSGLIVTLILYLEVSFFLINVIVNDETLSAGITIGLPFFVGVCYMIGDTIYMYKDE